MSDFYSTYVMGKDALYAMSLPECSKNNWHCYESNWRILHVDGFEPGYGSRTSSFRWSQSAVLGGFSDKTDDKMVAEL